MTDPSARLRPASDSRIQLSQLMEPEHGNLLGHVHGGTIARLVDQAGALAAMRHAQRPVVTVAIDSMRFMEPIFLGNLVTLDAQLTYVGRTSMEVRVNVQAENVIDGTCTHTNTAYVVYVALDDAGKPCPVPPLLLETDEDRARWERAKARQALRLRQRQLEET